MYYYRIGYDTNFCGCNEDKIVESEIPLTESEIELWAEEQVAVSPIFEELDEEDLSEDDKEFIEEFN